MHQIFDSLLENQPCHIFEKRKVTTIMYLLALELQLVVPL